MHEAAPWCCVLSVFAPLSFFQLPRRPQSFLNLPPEGVVHTPPMGTALLPFAPSSGRAAVDPTPTHTHTGRQAPGGWRSGLTCLSLTASLVAQLVKNPPAMWETWVRSLGWEDPLEKGVATRFRILAWRATRSVPDAS